MAVNHLHNSWVNKWRGIIRTPPWLRETCSLCSQEIPGDAGICWACAADLPFNNSACPACAIPMPEPLLCPACLKRRSSPIRSIFSPLCYRYPVNRLIHEMKYHSRLNIAGHLGQILLESILDEGLIFPDCLLPVPLHPLKLAERGYNQSLELARPLARAMKLPLDIKTCIRQRKTLTQTGLSVPQRRKNLRGAFQVVNKPEFRHVVIIDDVVTSGATVNELAKTLAHAGISVVDVWALARTA